MCPQQQFKLKQFRVKHNLTQIEMAKELNISVQAFRLWELEVSSPSPENQEKLNKFICKKEASLK